MKQAARLAEEDNNFFCRLGPQFGEALYFITFKQSKKKKKNRIVAIFVLTKFWYTKEFSVL